MKKCCAIACLFCVAAIAAWLPLDHAAADSKQVFHKHQHGNACADACALCANSCSSCVQHCIQQLAAGKKDHAATLRLCSDCADLCSLAAKVESRGGPLNVLICEACAKACEQCAAECGKFKDQPHMVECAQACMTCAASCREMIHHANHAR